MTLIALLVGLALERLLGYLNEFRDAAIWRRYAHALDNLILRAGLRLGGLRLLLILTIPVLLTAWLSEFLRSWWWGLIWLVFSIGVLFWCFGPNDLEDDVDAFIEALAREDDAQQIQIARRFLSEENVSEDAVERARQVAEATFYQANIRLFAVIFWFVIAGPLGAILYRLVATVAQPTESIEGSAQTDTARVDVELQSIALGFLSLLDWIPVRLEALGFAITGSFDHAFSTLTHLFWGYSGKLRETNRQLSAASGANAIGLDTILGDQPDTSRFNQAFSSIIIHVHRNLIVWLAVIALITLGGWLA